MQIRDATNDDAAAIRSVATASMESSYSLSPGTIESAVKNWYGEETFAEKLDDENVLLLVVETDDGIVAFSESELVDDQGDIHWLHVDPVYRGEGIGRRLFEETHERLEEAGARVLRGRVLADNAQGNDFYEQQGLHLTGEGKVDIDGSRYVENIYTTDEPPEPIVVPGPDEQDLFVDTEDSDRGSKGLFHVVYSDADRTSKYGFFCSNCETLVTSMDSMGRLECEGCGNVRKPTRWDAAYL